MCSQDVQWNDIDYMDQFLDFTFDSTKFGTLPDLVKDLHDHDQRYVMILVHRSFLFAFICVSDFAYLYDRCVSTCRIQASAARSLRAHTGRTMKGWGGTFLLKTPKEKHSLGRWETNDIPITFWNVRGVLEIRLSISSSRCGRVWQHILISLMMWHTSGGTRTSRDSTRRCILMDYGLWVWKWETIEELTLCNSWYLLPDLCLISSNK